MQLQDMAFNVSSDNVTVTTTAETVAVTSPAARVVRDRARVVILAWYQMTTGASTTHITPAIVRGAAAAGTDVAEKNAVSLAAAAGGNEQGFIIATDEQSGIESVQYSLTVQGTASEADNTVLQAGILVIVL